MIYDIFKSAVYGKFGENTRSKSVFISKYEEKLTLKISGKYKKIVKKSGDIFCNHTNSRLNDMLAYIYKNKLSVVSLYIKV